MVRQVQFKRGHFKLTVLLVHAPEFKMAIAFVSVIELVCIGDLCEKWPRVFGERVEEDAVNND